MATPSRFKRGFYSVTKRRHVKIAIAYVASLVIGILLLKKLSEEDLQDKTADPTIIIPTVHEGHHQPRINHEKRQHDRLHRIRKYCNESRSNKYIFHEFPNRNHYNFVVSEKYKFIICYVPKTGSSQWKDLLLNILATHPVTPNHEISLFDYTIFKFLNSYPSEQRLRMLNTYQTFFFVREPFERLLSAYRDKFVGKTTSLYEEEGKKIIREVRGDSTGKSTSDRPTFDEFTSYIDRLANPSMWDMHWRASHQTCYPCAINYDYVGYFETIKEDADYILKRLGLDKEFEFPSFKSGTPKLLETHYSQIPLDRIIRLAEIYRVDFEMFGFKYPDSIKRLFKDWV